MTHPKIALAAFSLFLLAALASCTKGSDDNSSGGNGDTDVLKFTKI